MPSRRGFARSDRVAEQIQHDLAEIIRTELKDPRVGMVTLTGVEVTPDYAHAKIFFTSLANDGHIESLAALQRAAGFLRSQLARRLQLRVVPLLAFHYDQSVQRGVELTHLIDQAVADKAKD